MPQNYKNKENKKILIWAFFKRKLAESYESSETLQKDNISLGKAAKTFDVKKTALHDHLKKRKNIALGHIMPCQVQWKKICWVETSL